VITIKRRRSCSWVASDFVIEGKRTRKRKYVSFAKVPNVLIVDDEHVVAFTLAAVLRSHGYSATFFTSPVEALAASQFRAPDLLICEVVMPVISGIDLAIRMRARHPMCKILLFSGHGAASDLVEEAEYRGHRFNLLLKPFPPTELQFEVGKMVNGAVLVDRLFLANSEDSRLQDGGQGA
jgi:DNA-binding NtrC family response regulator